MNDSNMFLEGLWAADGLGAGAVRPAQQARSRAKLIRLLQAGRNALQAGSLEEMKISEIVREASTSVGAFYGRFENKEGFFLAIQEMVIAEIDANMMDLFDGLNARQASLPELLYKLSAFWVSLYRDNRGLYRAAFKHASTLPDAWTPFKRLGYRGSAQIAENVLSRMEELGIECDEHRVKTAMQFVNGLLVNSIINDPGPVRLDSPEMEAHVARFLCTFLGVEHVEPPSFGRNHNAKSKRRPT